MIHTSYGYDYYPTLIFLFLLFWMETYKPSIDTGGHGWIMDGWTQNPIASLFAGAQGD